MNESTGKLVLGVAVPVLTAGSVAAGYLLVRNDLPARVATHFDASGTPDGSAAVPVFLGIVLALVIVGAGACVWVALTRRRLDRSAQGLVAFMGGFLAGLAAAIGSVTFWTQRGLDDWREVSDVWPLIVVPTVVAVAVGALAVRAATALPADDPTAITGQRPVMALEHSEHAVWIETVHSRWAQWSGTAMLCAAVIVGLVTAWWLAIPLVLGAAALASLGRVQVRADQRGLQVSFGALSWPRVSIDIDDIDHASVIDARPMQWGGWGYRGSLRLMNRAALIHRAGPALRLDLRDDKVFIVTLDDPEEPVSLLNAEVARIEV